MTTPAPTPPPCEQHHPLFLSVYLPDHIQAAQMCLSDELDDAGRPIPACPIFDWCRQERRHAAELNGKESIDGTWHGVLYVDGKATAEGKRKWIRREVAS